MNIIAKLTIALLCGAAAFGASTALPPQFHPALYFAAAIATALLTSLGGSPATSPAHAKQSRPSQTTAPQAQGPREQGQVKWFNVSKGFGFITKDNGDEIFVHFRSIRGEGRRGLSDGQRVSFVEAQTEKGPQAEDVEPL